MTAVLASLGPNLDEQLRLLPEYLAAHVSLSLAALAIGVGLSVPLGVLVARSRRLEGPVLGLAGVVQTVPSLALLALMVPLMGTIGWWPALTALVLYSMLPVLRGTVTGLHGVDRSVVEAAEGMGMTPWQRLVRVEMPLAGPSVIAGVRTAATWVVGIATLATPVGQTSLGNYIFAGLQTQNRAAVLVGVTAAAGLALALDAGVRLAEAAARRRDRRLAAAGAAVLLTVLMTTLLPLAAPASSGSGGAGAAARVAVTVGAKTFSEQYVLAEALSAHLRAAGFDATPRAGLGSQIAFDALREGAIDCYVDYTGTLWTNVLKRDGFPPRTELARELARELRLRYGVTLVGRLGFENAYALAVPRRTADRLGLRTVSDLTPHAPRMSLGGDVEFFARPEWRRVRDAYGLEFSRTVGLDATLMYAATDEGSVDAIVAFSSDGRIASKDLVVLADDRGAFPPYDAVILASRRAGDDATLMAALAGLTDTIDDAAMRQANRSVDEDGLPARAAAERLLSLALPRRPSPAPAATAVSDASAAPPDAGPPTPTVLPPGGAAR